jgi:hypothetical protein
MEVSMWEGRVLPPENERDDPGCAYLLDAEETAISCGLPRRPRSSYCSKHHALCHIACGTAAEVDRLREVEALACAVGGRQGWRGVQPSRPFLERLHYVVRDFS